MPSPNEPVDPLEQRFFQDRRFVGLARAAFRLAFSDQPGRLLWVVSGAGFGAITLSMFTPLEAAAAFRDALALAFSFSTSSLALVIAGFAIFTATGSGGFADVLAEDTQDKTKSLAEDYSLRFVEPLLPMFVFVSLQFIAALMLPKGSPLSLWLLRQPSEVLIALQLLGGLSIGFLVFWMLAGVASLISNSVKVFLMMVGHRVAVREPIGGDSGSAPPPTLGLASEAPAPSPQLRIASPVDKSRDANDDDDGLGGNVTDSNERRGA